VTEEEIVVKKIEEKREIELPEEVGEELAKMKVSFSGEEILKGE